MIQTTIWYPYYVKHKEIHKEEKEDDVNLQEPEIYSAIPWCFWIFKLLIVIVAYFMYVPKGVMPGKLEVTKEDIEPFR